MYLIRFSDSTIFSGDNPPNSKWNQIPDKPIWEIEYELFGSKLAVTNYVAYNHLWEQAYIGGNVQRLVNIDRGVNITKVLLMGKKSSGEVDVYVFTKNRDIQHYVADFGKEFNDRPTTGWKKGITND